MQKVSIQWLEKLVCDERYDELFNYLNENLSQSDKANLFGVSCRDVVRYLTGETPFGFKTERMHDRVERKLRRDLTLVLETNERFLGPGLRIIDDFRFTSWLGDPKNTQAMKLVVWLDPATSPREMWEMFVDTIKPTNSAQESLEIKDFEKALNKGLHGFSNKLDEYFNKEDRVNLRGVPVKDFVRNWCDTRGMFGHPVDIERVADKVRNTLPRRGSREQHLVNHTSGPVLVHVDDVKRLGLWEGVPGKYKEKIETHPTIQLVVFWVEKNESLLDLKRQALESSGDRKGTVAPTSQPNSFVKEVPSGTKSVTVETNGAATVTIKFQGE